MYTDGEARTERWKFWSEKQRCKNSSKTERRQGKDDSETEIPETMR
jgi:hypothetical protein